MKGVFIYGNFKKIHVQVLWSVKMLSLYTNASKNEVPE